jgi:hypothetical protein
MLSRRAPDRRNCVRREPAHIVSCFRLLAGPLRRAFIEKGIHEREFGTPHLGIGNGITFGGTIRAVGHIDLVIRHPIVDVDGKGVLKERYVPV